jgi:hypothetical protein
VPKQQPNTTDITGDIIVSGDDTVDGFLKVDDGGTATITSKNRPPNSIGKAVFKLEGSTPYLLNFGTVELKDRADLQFIFNAAIPNNGGPGGFRQQQGRAAPGQPAPQVPVLKIEAGCFITCESTAWVCITAGNVELAERRNAGVPEADQPDITITAGPTATALEINQNATLKRADATPMKQLDLVIKNAGVSLDCDGTLELYAEKDGDASDKILASNGRVTFGQTATVRMKWFNNAGSLAGDWVLIESTYTGQQAAITGNPNFVDPPLNPPYELLVPGLNSNNKKYQVQRNS